MSDRDEINQNMFEKGADRGEFNLPPKLPKHPESQSHYLHGHRVGSGMDKEAHKNKYAKEYKEHESHNWGNGKGNKNGDVNYG